MHALPLEPKLLRFADSVLMTLMRTLFGLLILLVLLLRLAVLVLTAPLSLAALAGRSHPGRRHAAVPHLEI